MNSPEKNEALEKKRQFQKVGAILMSLSFITTAVSISVHSAIKAQPKSDIMKLRDEGIPEVYLKKLKKMLRNKTAEVLEKKLPPWPIDKKAENYRHRLIIIIKDEFGEEYYRFPEWLLEQPDFYLPSKEELIEGDYYIFQDLSNRPQPPYSYGILELIEAGVSEQTLKRLNFTEKNRLRFEPEMSVDTDHAPGPTLVALQFVKRPQTGK